MRLLAHPTWSSTPNWGFRRMEILPADRSFLATQPSHTMPCAPSIIYNHTTWGEEIHCVYTPTKRRIIAISTATKKPLGPCLPKLDFFPLGTEEACGRTPNSIVPMFSTHNFPAHFILEPR